jgi:phosphatidylglycerophosphatase A
MNLIQLITTGLGSGLAPKAPGTFGTVAAALVWLVCLPLFSYATPRYLATLTVIIVGIWATHLDLKARKLEHRSHENESILEGENPNSKEHIDPKEIVIDEWAGLFVTYSLSAAVDPWSMVLGFALFRYFDISKVGPVGAVEKLPGAWGIMLDDIVAGALAGLILILLSQASVLPQ